MGINRNGSLKDVKFLATSLGGVESWVPGFVLAVIAHKYSYDLTASVYPRQPPSISP